MTLSIKANGPNKETIQFGSVQLSFLLDGEDTNDTMVVFEFIVQPKAKVPAPHFHVAVNEMLYGLEGVLTQTVGEKVQELKSGDSCFIPRGVVHGFTNGGDAAAWAGAGAAWQIKQAAGSFIIIMRINRGWVEPSGIAMPEQGAGRAGVTSSSGC